MDFEFFEQLSDDEAKAYLDRYLEVESEKVAESIREARADGVEADFSVESLPQFLSWIFRRVQPVEVEQDPDLPEWIREAQESIGGFIEVADESSHLVLRASYYLGESFVRSFPKLKWRLGRPKTLNQKAPVVAGFGDGTELSPLLVAENMARGAVRRPADSSNADAVQAWIDKV